MLKAVDEALAGAIDVVADDISATVKSVREQGVMRTLGDAVEDAAGMVKNGAGSLLSGVAGSHQKGPETVSSHSGLGSAYADLCAGPGKRSAGAANVAYPQMPNGSAAFPHGLTSGAASAGTVGQFAPGIGIQRNAVANAGATPVFSRAPGAGYMGSVATQLHRPGAQSVSSPASTPSAATNPSKEATLEPVFLKRRLDQVRAGDSANQQCFDCGSRDTEWASVSFGIFLCIACAGHHRQLGTHISRIRSCKMDSWTERQLQILTVHGGNRRLLNFFSANKVPANLHLQRYSTPAAEWYREAWIKNRTMERSVPTPPAGVVKGACVDDSAAAQEAKSASQEHPVDLLDLGSDSKTAPKEESKSTDLLTFESSSLLPAGDVTPKQGKATLEADLLDVGVITPSAASVAAHMQGATVVEADLLGVGTGGSQPAGEVSDLLGLGTDAQTSSSSLLASVAPTPTPAATVMPGADFSLSALTLDTAMATGPATHAAAGTLAGGAKLEDSVKVKSKDELMFSAALEKWGV